MNELNARINPSISLSWNLQGAIFGIVILVLLIIAIGVLCWFYAVQIKTKGKEYWGRFKDWYNEKFKSEENKNKNRNVNRYEDEFDDDYEDDDDEEYSRKRGRVKDIP